MNKSPFNFVDEFHNAYGVKHVGNKLRMVSTPYSYAIAKGDIPGHEAFKASGAREAVAVITNGSDLWYGAATTQPYPVDAGEQLAVASTSALDGVAGTGILTLNIHYLDETGAEGEEVVTMNGITPVLLTETNVRFVQSIHARTVGTNGVAVGDVTIFLNGTPTRVYNVVKAGGNMALSSMAMVPLGKTFYLSGGFATAVDKAANIRLRITSDRGILRPGVFLFHGSWFLHDSALAFSMDFPIPCPARTKIKLSAYVPAGKAGADVSGGFEGWFE
jgi:hypothetical protein